MIVYGLKGEDKVRVLVDCYNNVYCLFLLFLIKCLVVIIKDVYIVIIFDILILYMVSVYNIFVVVIYVDYKMWWFVMVDVLELVVVG